MPLNALAKYWLIGMTDVFPRVPVCPRDLPPLEMYESESQYLLGLPLHQIALSGGFPWDPELEDSFIRARTQFLARLNGFLDRPLTVTKLEPQLGNASDSHLGPCARLVAGDESVCLLFRPFGNEFDAMGASLIAVTSVGVLSAMVEGAMTREEAKALIFQPTTSSLVGKMPFGDGLVSGLQELERALFRFDSEAPTNTQFVFHMEEYLECVSLFFENVEANLEFDPRWAMSSRSARSILRHHV